VHSYTPASRVGLRIPTAPRRLPVVVTRANPPSMVTGSSSETATGKLRQLHASVSPYVGERVGEDYGEGTNERSESRHGESAAAKTRISGK